MARSRDDFDPSNKDFDFNSSAGDYRRHDRDLDAHRRWSDRHEHGQERRDNRDYDRNRRDDRDYDRGEDYDRRDRRGGLFDEVEQPVIRLRTRPRNDTLDATDFLQAVLCPTIALTSANFYISRGQKKGWTLLYIAGAMHLFWILLFGMIKLAASFRR